MCVSMGSHRLELTGWLHLEQIKELWHGPKWQAVAGSAKGVMTYTLRVITF